MSTTKYDHLPEQEKHAALAREEAAIKAEALRYHDKHRMTPAKVAKLTARHVVLALLAAFWLIPILWLVVTSFGVDKGPNLSTFFPKAYTLDHYKALLSPDSVNQFPQWMLNTFIVACFTCVISTLFVLMVAYAMSCMRFKARKPLMNIAIILNLFPRLPEHDRGLLHHEAVRADRHADRLDYRVQRGFGHGLPDCEGLLRHGEQVPA